MSQRFDVISPVDGAIVASMPEATPAQIARTLDRASEAKGNWKSAPLQERIAYIEAFLSEFESKTDQIAESITRCMGRPIRFAPGEVKGTVDRARTMIELAEQALQDVVPPAQEGFERRIKRVPHGVVFVLSPWNYPYLTAINALVPALLAGNTVIMKPSDQTPLAGEHFREAFAAAGLPNGVFQVLHMSHEKTAHVLADDCIDHVAFTGSVEGGIAVSNALAGRTGDKRFIGAGLELGGNDPAYIRQDADLSHAVPNVIEGALFNSGQSCCAIERVYIHKNVYDDFLNLAIEEVYRYILGNPTELATTLGPMVRQRNADHVRDVLKRATTQGARALIDPKRFPADDPASPYLAPQLLVDVNHNMDLVQSETFGPCVGLMKVDSDDQAVRMMNDSSHGLTASVWTPDIEAASRIGHELETGTVFLNRCDYLDPYLSWTGIKNSGRGATLSRVGLEHMTRPKSFHFRTKG